MNQPELIEQLQQGDESAFKALVEEWQGLVYNTAIVIVQNEEDADDITQETFIQVYQSFGSFKGDAKISTWLYRIAINKALDHEKKKKRKRGFAFVQNIFGKATDDYLHPVDFNHPGVQLENKERAVELFAAIRQLPEKQRVAYSLNKLEGQSYQEIAEIMNTSLYAVESLLGRAKANLKATLKKYYENNISEQ